MEEIKGSFDFLIEEGYEDRYASSVVERDGAKVIDVTDTWLGTTAFFDTIFSELEKLAK